MQTARVSSIEALRLFKAALQQFMLQTDKALVEADLELQRMQGWVQRDQPAYWHNELKKRHDEVERAKDDLRRIQLSIADRPPSAVEQKKALSRARDRYESARNKAETTRQWQVRLEQAGNEYKGQVQHIATAIEADLPRAVTAIERAVTALEEYTSVAAPAADQVAMSSGTEAMPTARVSGTPIDTDPFADFPLAACIALRRITLEPFDRDALPLSSTLPDDEGEALRIKQQRADAQRERPALLVFRDRVTVPRVKPARDARIVFEDGALDAECIFMDRKHVDAECAVDSGWYIGHISRKAIDAKAGRHSTTVADVLRIRPEWRELLSLPHGYLAIVDEEGELRRLIDPHDVDLLDDVNAATEDEVQ